MLHELRSGGCARCWPFPRGERALSPFEGPCNRGSKVIMIYSCPDDGKHRQQKHARGFYVQQASANEGLATYSYQRRREVA